MFCRCFLHFKHVTSSRSISISRLAYTLLNRGGQKLLREKDSTHAVQLLRDST